MNIDVIKLTQMRDELIRMEKQAQDMQDYFNAPDRLGGLDEIDPMLGDQLGDAREDAWDLPATINSMMQAIDVSLQILEDNGYTDGGE